MPPWTSAFEWLQLPLFKQIAGGSLAWKIVKDHFAVFRQWQFGTQLTTQVSVPVTAVFH